MPSPLAVALSAVRGSPMAVMPMARPNVVSNKRVPRAMIHPLVTPPQRTRTPIGGVPRSASSLTWDTGRS